MFGCAETAFGREEIRRREPREWRQMLAVLAAIAAPVSVSSPLPSVFSVGVARESGEFVIFYAPTVRYRELRRGLRWWS
jgi:hypothetical protein